MTKESNLWAVVKEVLNHGHVIRVENDVETGTPDVHGCISGVSFWIELKVAELPKQSATNISVPHFTQEQRTWLFNHCRAGGNAWLLLQVGGAYFLLNGVTAAVLVGKADYQQLTEAACWYGHTLRDKRFLSTVMEGVINGRKAR